MYLDDYLENGSDGVVENYNKPHEHRPNSGHFKTGEKNLRCKRTAVYDLNFKKLGEFESGKLAGEFIGATQSRVSQCCIRGEICKKLYYVKYV